MIIEDIGPVDRGMIESNSFGKIIFSAERANQQVRVEISGESNLSDTLDAIETFLIAAGFHPDSVKQSFK